MPRKPRLALPGITQQGIPRANNREPWFIVEKDYSQYVCDLYETAHQHNYLEKIAL